MGKWTWKADASLNGGYNSQSYNTVNSQILNGVNVGNVALNRSNNAFTPWLDMSSELTLNISRDVALKAGTQLNYMWSGLTRAHTVIADNNPNSLSSGPGGVISTVSPFIPTPSAISQQGVFIAGFTLGIEWRR